MIKKYLWLVYTVLAILGCGAQQKSDEEEVILDINPKEIILPHKISIEFPLEVFKLNHMHFHQDIERLDRKIDVLENYIFSLNSIFPDIVKRCEGKNPCTYEEEHNLSFKSIEFFKNSKRSPYEYKLLLITDSSNKIVLEWRVDNSNVLTKYIRVSDDLLLHYFDNLVGEEALYVDENDDVNHTGMLVHTKEKSREYHLSANHIKLKEESFSSNILLKNDEVTEYNENIFLVDALSQDLERGDFLLLDMVEGVQKLTMIEKLKYSKGIFSIFRDRSQGFVYDDLSVEEIDSLEIFRLE